MLKIFSGASLAGLLVSGLIGAGTAVVPVWVTAHNAGFGKAEKRHVDVEERFFAREAVLWYELGAARQAQGEMAAGFADIIDGTDEARAAAKQAYLAERRRADQAVNWVADALKELDRVENEWKGKPVPPDVIRPFCVRDGQAGCAPTPSRAGGLADLAIRGGTAGTVPGEDVPGAVGRDAE